MINNTGNNFYFPTEENPTTTLQSQRGGGGGGRSTSGSNLNNRVPVIFDGNEGYLSTSDDERYLIFSSAAAADNINSNNATNGNSRLLSKRWLWKNLCKVSTTGFTLLVITLNDSRKLHFVVNNYSTLMKTKKECQNRINNESKLQQKQQDEEQIYHNVSSTPATITKKTQQQQRKDHHAKSRRRKAAAVSEAVFPSPPPPPRRPPPAPQPTTATITSVVQKQQHGNQSYLLNSNNANTSTNIPNYDDDNNNYYYGGGGTTTRRRSNNSMTHQQVEDLVKKTLNQELPYVKNELLMYLNEEIQRLSTSIHNNNNNNNNNSVGQRGGDPYPYSEKQEMAAPMMDRSPYGDLDPTRTTLDADAELAAGAVEKKEKDHFEDELLQLKFVEPKPSPAETQHDLLDDELEQDTLFGESSYTLLYMYPVKSHAFWFGIIIYGFQIATIVLTLWDIIDWSSNENHMKLSPMVGPAVSGSQAVTLFMLPAFMSDLIEAILKLQDGYHLGVTQQFPGATYATWLCSCLAQLSAGLLVLFASFILTLQSSNVIDLILNLTALTFIGEIDDVAFYMAKMGFVTNKLQSQTIRVKKEFVHHLPRRKTSNFCGRILYVLALVALFSGFGILKYIQLHGIYLPTYVYVQFGDSYNPRIPYYSGLLKSIDTRTTGYREYHDLGTENMILSYCNSEKAWAFSFREPCSDIFAKSSSTTSFDVTTIPASDWQVKDTKEILTDSSKGRFLPFESFTLIDQDCNPSTCQGTCNTVGAAKLCDCGGGDSFGLDCEFANVCENLMTVRTLSSFQSVTAGGQAFAISDEFHLLKNPSKNDEYVRVYNMPVYYSNKTYPANVLFFGGRRWLLTTELDLFNLTQARIKDPTKTYFPERTIEALINHFHGDYNATYTPFFISDPVDFGTPKFSATPIGIGWWTLKKRGRGTYEPDTQVVTQLRCSPTTCVGKDIGPIGMGGGGGGEAPGGRPNGTSVVLGGGGEGDPSGLGGRAGGSPPDGEVPGGGPKADPYCVFGDCNSETGLCECDPLHQYTGDRCNIPPACFAQPRPCSSNGSCEKGSGTCRCNLPYFGDLCESHYKCYEEYGSCKSGGVCNEVTGECDCPDDPSISGLACEKRLACSAYGCANGGYCASNGLCVCPPPFYGALCDLVDTTQEDFFCSSDEECNEEGETESSIFWNHCNVETGICTCDDPTLYGTLCQYRYNCANSKNEINCLNGGRCTHEEGRCDCPPPYFGPDCSSVPSCVDDDDCSGDKCNIDDGTCTCYWGPVAGKLCEKEWECKSDQECKGGTCDPRSGECECPLGRTGWLCDIWVVDMYEPFLDYQYQRLEENAKVCGYDDPYCNDVGWVYLPEEVRSAAEVLGYNENSWDQSLMIPRFQYHGMI